MSFFDDPPIHDFPNRAICRLLENRHNLRDLVTAEAPDLAARLDFDRAEIVRGDFLLEDWRGRESDLLFRIPCRTDEGEVPVLVCLLIEHQSQPDARMPLRLLLYAALFWEKEWREWESEEDRSASLCLTPIIPIVFHTGSRPWNTNRTLAELMPAPEWLRRFVPEWPILFWNLAEHTPEELVRAAGAFVQALAVVRAEKDEKDAFLKVWSEVLQRLEPLSEQDKMRWRELLWFLLSWGLRRREPEDRQSLIATAQASQAEVHDQEEIKAMSTGVGMTWDEVMEAKAQKLGQQRYDEAKMQALRDFQETLQSLLEDHFGVLPASLLERIKSAADIGRLKTAIRQVPRLNKLEDLQL